MAGVPWWAQVLGAVAAIGGTVGTILRQIWKNDYRSHKPDCKCSVCRERRQDAEAKSRAWKQLQARRSQAEDMLYRVEPRPEDPERVEWYSTAELDTNMRVEFRGTAYLIKEVKTNSNGYFIYVRNELTRVDFVVQVGFALATKRMWVPMGGWASAPGPIISTTWDPRVPVGVGSDDEQFKPEGSFRPCIIDGCILESGHEGDCRFRNTGHSGV